MGDAAHPMVPFMGQGACMSIEDAYIFSRLLEGCKKDLEHKASSIIFLTRS